MKPRINGRVCGNQKRRLGGADGEGFNCSGF